jgi:tetratricopeptide (TPR) repeat protein
MRSGILVRSALLVALALQLIPRSALSQVATFKESTQVFRTYPFGDPDPVARMSNIYPYFRFEGYSITPVDREWKIVTLENPYIKVLIAPEMGGKVLGAFEKSTGKAFIYFNRVIKFREIAMRGPWTSGGLEFNFGDIGHTPTTATPVDYVTRTNEDGSVSCIIGAMDLPSRTEWRVEIRLPKDKAYFETHSFWYNPTELNTSLYHWMCAAADADSDLRFIYPGTSYIDHGGGAYAWPVDNAAREISQYAENAFGSSKSYHVLGAYTDTYAAYWANDDFGVVHWSPYTDKPGKKIWIWALSREGEIWKDLLTDPELGNKQYVEIQSGLLFNQAGGGSSVTPFKHQFFAPLSSERFIDVWFPFMKIGGLVEANRHGSLNVQRRGNTVTIGFCPLEKTRTVLTVSVGGKSVYSKNVDLEPLQAFSDSISAPSDGELRVSVGDLLSYRSTEEEARRLHRPIVANKEFDWNSVAGLYTEGVERAKQRDYSGALEKYLRCLSKDPVYSPALVGTAEVFYRRMEYEKALDCASRALANDAYDPDANFIYGVINRQMGRFYGAEDGFGVAARSMKYRSAANAQLGEIAFLRGRWNDAEEYARRALDYDRYNMRAYRQLALTYRKQGRSEHAKAVLEMMLRIDPLSHFADFERYLLDPTAEKLAHFNSMIRNELPHETYLELASYYRSVGLADDAIRALEQAPKHAIVLYWLAYLNEKENQSAKAEQLLNEGLRAPPSLVFPFRAETGEILQWALTKKPHWKTRYYLGLLYWSKDRLDLAKKYLAECGNEPDYAPFYLTRGNLFRMDNPEAALNDYRSALRLGANEWRAYHRLLEFYNERGDHEQALKIAQAGVLNMPWSYVLQLGCAKTLLFNRRFNASLSILDTITILPFEGARSGREIHRQVCVLSAVEAMKNGRYRNSIELLSKARQWPERLGVGRPYEVDDRLEDCLEALCRRELGEQAKARGLLEKVVGYTQEHASDWGALRLLGALAFRALGHDADARKSVAEWVKRDPKNAAAKWSSLVYAKQRRQSQKVELQIRNGFRGSLLSKGSVDQNFALIMEIQSLLVF